MNLCEYLKVDDILLGLAARTRADVLRLVAERAAAALGLPVVSVLKALADRETLGSTGVGQGVALPHTALPGLTAPFAVAAKLAAPVDWGAIDDVGVDLVVAVLTPPDGPTTSLNLIARIARQFRDEGLRRRLRRAETTTGFLDVLATDAG